jgi:dTDP-4-dehydrorhamnose 3,5-epimerase
MEAVDIDGAWLFTPQVHADSRGCFLEWFKDAELHAGLGHSMNVTQANCSVSRRGVIRGIHFADVPPGQAKYVTCASGAIMDVVVDLRQGSAGFGRWAAVQLDDENHQALYISEGLGHAFVALSDQATVLYLCSTPYAPKREHAVHALDPAIGIAWPENLDKILSDKDASAPMLADAQAAGLLPVLADCQAYTDGLRSKARGHRSAHPG